MTPLPLSAPFIERVGWVLVHSVWQFAVIALAAMVLAQGNGRWLGFSVQQEGPDRMENAPGRARRLARRGRHSHRPRPEGEPSLHRAGRLRGPPFPRRGQ